VDIACGKLVYASRPELLNAAFGAMNRFGVAWDAGVGDPAARYDHPRPCLWASTSAVAIRRSAVASIGGFDEAMFAAHEDCDFGWRANLLGYRVVFNPDAVAMHNVHGTFRGNVRMAHLLYRNRLRSALVNYEAVHVAQYVGAYLLMAVADIVVRGPRMAKISALAWNARNLRDTLRRRAEVQSKRIVRDRDLWSLFETGVRGPGYAGY
jgi:hypothetical protein